MGYAFDSDEAKDLNQDIFETIYYGAMESSMEISKEREMVVKEWRTENPNGPFTDEFLQGEVRRDSHLGSYSTFLGSPLHQGKFQFDLWLEGEKEGETTHHSGNHDWPKLMTEVQKYGVRNSLLVAPMPTASTAQILGSYECFEPIMSNIYTRRVLAGEYMVLNDYLIEDLQSLGLWSLELKDKIIVNDGSVQAFGEIPSVIRDRYKTVWELKQKDIIDMARDRGQYICQSQSLNLFLESPDISTLTSMHFYAWSQGLKTGIYYLRSRPSSKAIQFSINASSTATPADGPCESCSG